MKIFLFLILSCQTLMAQSHNDATWVLGFESDIQLKHKEENRLTKFFSTVGVLLEKPVGQWSIGAGLYYRATNNFTLNKPVNNKVVPVSQDARSSDKYEFQQEEYQPKYISASARLSYRLPCNCFFVHMGYEMDVLAHNPLIRSYNYFTKHKRRLTESAKFKSALHNVTIGFGTVLPINGHLKFHFMPSLRFSEIAVSDYTELYNGIGTTLTAFIGLRYGLNS